VAISREELAALGLKKETSPEPPEDSPPEQPPDFEENYEATVAISREELSALGLKKETSPDPPEEPSDFERDYEATVAISRQELRELGLKAEAREADLTEPPEEHIETEPAPSEVPAYTPKEETDSPKASEQNSEGDVSRGILGISDECILETKEEPKRIFNGNVTISRGELKIESDVCSEDYSASELEDEFYRRAVAKDHGHNKYKFIRKLVSGGMGSIFKVQDQDLNRLSAMKVILPRFKSNEDTLCDFITEAKITGLLEHPNVIPVHELGLLRDTGLFFTMKLLGQGESLNDILNEIRRGNPEYVEKYNTYHLLNIFRKVCDAVSYSHSFNIVHRDIKPHNIMVGDYGEVLLMDWGIAQFVGNPGDENDPTIREVREDIEKYTKGKKDMIKGSPTYMSPEQVIGEPHLLDKRSDIFLLGSTLYHMFTFEAPYFGKDIYEILRKAETGDLVPPQIRNPATQIPEEICRIIMKAMAHRKENRYQNVEELASDIDDLISGKWSRQEKKVFQPGEMLMREGEEGEEAYLILSGEVQVVKESEGHKIVLATLKEGDVIGEMSLISKEKVTRSASVEALKKTEAAILTKHVISQNLKKLPPYMEKIVATLTDRLREANTKIHPHASGDCTHIILKQLRMIYKDRSSKKARNLGVPLKDLIEEISSDLGLSRKKVEAVLSKALEVNLISDKKDKIYIPDMSELAHFADSKKS
jgi:serine/threonine-protein kinase